MHNRGRYLWLKHWVHVERLLRYLRHTIEGRMRQRYFNVRWYFNIDLTNALRVDVELVVGQLDVERCISEPVVGLQAACTRQV